MTMDPDSNYREQELIYLRIKAGTAQPGDHGRLKARRMWRKRAESSLGPYPSMATSGIIGDERDNRCATSEP